MGIFKDKKGYLRWNDSGKLVHRTVASNMIGGSIGRGRVVQHGDGNKSNFKQNNLTVMSGRSHSSLHARKRHHTDTVTRKKTSVIWTKLTWTWRKDLA